MKKTNIKNKKEKGFTRLVDFDDTSIKDRSGLRPSSKFTTGFTLVELMVSISIFMVIMLAAMGAVFVSLDAVKKVRAQQAAVDSINYAMESMARSIRLGTKYYCVDSGMIGMDDSTSVKDCSGGASRLAFVPQNFDETGLRVAYIKEERANGTGDTIKRCSNGSINNCPELVAPSVNVDMLKFIVTGAEDSTNTHPKVLIMMKGTVMVKNVPTSFAIQTIASQRNLK